MLELSQTFNLSTSEGRHGQDLCVFEKPLWLCQECNSSVEFAHVFWKLAKYSALADLVSFKIFGLRVSLDAYASFDGFLLIA